MIKANHPGLVRPLDSDSLYWLPLLALPPLEKIVYAKHTALPDLTKTRSKRCATLGRTLWHIWKYRMKEIYIEDFLFMPSQTADTLATSLRSD
jgi:hypothetical protein